MHCPFCQAEDTRVVETRNNFDLGSIRRRRECQDCHRRFTTFERQEEATLYVIKKDHRRERFDREKLLNGLSRACEKRPISRETIEEITYDIERELYDALYEEISSAAIGDMVMQRLRNLDEVAYVRFASVYKEFRDLSSFMEEIQRLFNQSKQNNEGQTALFEN